MALAVYQELFCRMVASPALRARLIERPDELLHGLDLTVRERQRLLSLAAQPGMPVNTAIHRANRIAPIDQTLPLTCVLLGEQLRDLLEAYWSANPMENLQLPAECERFGAYLEQGIRDGIIDPGPYLEEVLRFERVCTELRFFTEDELRLRATIRTGLPMLVRIVPFRHHPAILLAALTEGQMPPGPCPSGAFHLLIDARSGEADFRMLDAEGLAALEALARA